MLAPCHDGGNTVHPPPEPDGGPGEDLSPPSPIRPTTGNEREPILDVLRGFALLGILLVNIALMRGPELYTLLAGEIPDPSEGIDRIVDGAVSWLATGKFVSSFSLLFGVGAGLIVGRALAAGRSPHGLLARRYVWLLAFGLAHMILLFPGDILFVYGITGMVLLAFINVQPRTAVWISVALIASVTAITVGFTALSAVFGDVQAQGASGDPFTAAFEGFFAARQEQAISAFTEGSYLDVIVANAWQSLLVQSGQLFVLPWILGLFLLGFAVTRAGIPLRLAEHRPLLRRAALLGLGIGLPLNATMGLVDPLSLIAGGPDASVGTGMLVLITFAQQAGAPALAIGYLSALALLCLRIGPIRPLAAVGRMALTAYLLQSLLALIVFAGFDRYGQLSSAEAMLVVVGIWTILLVACPLWLRFFRFGPAEWLWRSLTYGARQPLRRRSLPAASPTD
jgi:uncharacterized protein